MTRNGVLLVGIVGLVLGVFWWIVIVGRKLNIHFEKGKMRPMDRSKRNVSKKCNIDTNICSNCENMTHVICGIRS